MEEPVTCQESFRLLSEKKCRLFTPDRGEDFFCLEKKNGYEVGLQQQVLLNYLKNVKQKSSSLAVINGYSLLEDAVLEGMRHFNYPAMEKAGKRRYGFWYRGKHGFKKKEGSFFTGLNNYRFIPALLQEEKLVIRHTRDSLFLEGVDVKELYNYPLGKFQEYYINETLVFRTQILFH